MAVAFTHLSWWLWGGKDHEPATSSSPASNCSTDFGLGFRDPDSMIQFSSGEAKMRSTPPRRNKRKWQSREERRIDREYDLVLVPSDGGCLSGSETDDSDWSIGWLEPHAPDFQSDTETESSFAVLVPCYGRGRCDRDRVETTKNHMLGMGVVDYPNTYYSSEEKKYMEQWLSSLQNI